MLSRIEKRAAMHWYRCDRQRLIHRLVIIVAPLPVGIA